jgi:hypothetical protein
VLLFDIALTDPRRDEKSGNTAAETIEGESVALARGCTGRIRQIVRPGSERGRNVIVEAASLVKGQDEEGLFPLRTGTECFIYLLDESLAGRDQTCGMHRSGANPAARGVKEAE